MTHVFREFQISTMIYHQYILNQWQQEVQNIPFATNRRDDAALLSFCLFVRYRNRVVIPSFWPNRTSAQLNYSLPQHSNALL